MPGASFRERIDISKAFILSHPTRGRPMWRGTSGGVYKRSSSLDGYFSLPEYIPVSSDVPPPKAGLQESRGRDSSRQYSRTSSVNSATKTPADVETEKKKSAQGQQDGSAAAEGGEQERGQPAAAAETPRGRPLSARQRNAEPKDPIAAALHPHAFRGTSPLPGIPDKSYDFNSSAAPHHHQFTAAERFHKQVTATRTASAQLSGSAPVSRSSSCQPQYTPRPVSGENEPAGQQRVQRSESGTSLPRNDPPGSSARVSQQRGRPHQYPADPTQFVMEPHAVNLNALLLPPDIAQRVRKQRQEQKKEDKYRQLAQRQNQIFASRYNLVTKSGMEEPSSQEERGHSHDRADAGTAPRADGGEKSASKSKSLLQPMHRVPQQGLRVEYYDRGRKMKIDPNEPSSQKLHSYSASSKHSKDEETASKAADVPQDNEKSQQQTGKEEAAAGTNGTAAAADSKTTAAEEKDKTKKASTPAPVVLSDDDDEESVLSNLTAAELRLRCVPSSFFDALRSLRTQPSSYVSFVVHLMMLLIRNDTALNKDTDDAWTVLREFLLSHGKDDYVPMLLHIPLVDVSRERVLEIRDVMDGFGEILYENENDGRSFFETKPATKKKQQQQQDKTNRKQESTEATTEKAKAEEQRTKQDADTKETNDNSDETSLRHKATVQQLHELREYLYKELEAHNTHACTIFAWVHCFCRAHEATQHPTVLK